MVSAMHHVGPAEILVLLARKGPVAALNSREQQLGSGSRRRLRFAGCSLGAQRVRRAPPNQSRNQSRRTPFCASSSVVLALLLFRPPRRKPRPPHPIPADDAPILNRRRSRASE
jgi:hypothetical protein